MKSSESGARRGPDYGHEGHEIAGVTAFAGYSLAVWQLHIWYHPGISITLKSTLDGLIYALLTAGTFGWLWPR